MLEENARSGEPITNSGAENLNASTAMSKAEYKALRKRTTLDIGLSVFVTLLFSVLSCAIIWAAISSYDEKNSTSWLVTLVFAGGGLAVLVLALKACLSNISWDLKQQRAMKEKYLSSISEDEKQKRAHKIKTAKIVSLICVLIAISSAITAVTVEQIHLNAVYSKAEKLIDEEQFEEAEASLKKIEDSNYKDTVSLLLLCDAHGDYSSGRTVEAYYTMNKAHFSHQSTEAMNKIRSFKQILEQEYDRYIKELSERESQTFKDRIINGVPYVGMSESRIGDTSLGKPSSNVRHNVEIKNGERYTAVDTRSLIYVYCKIGQNHSISIFATLFEKLEKENKSKKNLRKRLVFVKIEAIIRCVRFEKRSCNNYHQSPYRFR